MPKKYHKLHEIEEALTKARANVGVAADLLGLARQSVYERISRSEKLQKLCYEIEQKKLDQFEHKVEKMALVDSHPTMLLAFLNAKGRDRGWGRHTVDYSGKLDVNQKVEHKLSVDVKIALEQATPEELRVIERMNQRLIEGKVDKKEVA